jgi:hypothetical protein
MIYLLSTTEIKPGKLAAHMELLGKELVPLQQKVGFKLAGSFHGYTGNMNMNYSLYVFNDLAAYQRAREAQQKDKALLEVVARLYELRVSLTQQLIELNPWSPVK